MTSAEAPASILDASAVLALLNDESDADAVTDAMANGAAISVVNWAEVLSKVAERGAEPEETAAALRRAEGSRRALSIEPLTAADCVAVARPRPLTRRQGLSLADRACLALAGRIGVPALTTDGAFVEANVDIEVVLIR